MPSSNYVAEAPERTSEEHAAPLASLITSLVPVDLLQASCPRCSTSALRLRGELRRAAGASRGPSPRDKPPAEQPCLVLKVGGSLTCSGLMLGLLDYLGVFESGPNLMVLCSLFCYSVAVSSQLLYVCCCLVAWDLRNGSFSAMLWLPLCALQMPPALLRHFGQAAAAHVRGPSGVPASRGLQRSVPLLSGPERNASYR